MRLPDPIMTQDWTKWANELVRTLQYAIGDPEGINLNVRTLGVEKILAGTINNALNIGNASIVIDGPNSRISIFASTIEVVRIGKQSDGKYGITIWDQSGVKIWDNLLGLQTEAVQNDVIISDHVLSLNIDKLNAGTLGVTQYIQVGTAPDYVRIDGNAQKITVFQSNIARVIIGKLGAGSFGIQILDASSQIMFDSVTGLGAPGVTAKVIDGTQNLINNTVGNLQLADLSVNAQKLAALAVEAGKIAVDAVDTAEIKALAVTAAELGANAVIAGKIAADAVGTAEIAASAVTANEIGANAVIAGKIAAAAVSDIELATDAVTAIKIAADAVTTAKIAIGAVGSNEIAAGAVIAGKIAAGVVTAAEIAAGTVTAAEIATDTITATQIAANAITASEISAGAVIAGKIAADAITASEIAAGAITASELSAGAVTAGKIAALAVEAGNIAAGAIVAADIAADTITGAKIAAGAISASEIAAGAVTAGKIAALAVEAGDIAANAVTASEIAANTITAAEIAAGAIGATEIAANAVVAGKIASGVVGVEKLVVADFFNHFIDPSFESITDINDTAQGWWINLPTLFPPTWSLDAGPTEGVSPRTKGKMVKVVTHATANANIDPRILGPYISGTYWMPAVEGDEIVMTGYVARGTVGPAAQGIAPFLSFYDKAGTNISLIDGVADDPTNAWTKLRSSDGDYLKGVAPANTAYVTGGVVLRKEVGTSKTFFIDDLRLRRSVGEALIEKASIVDAHIANLTAAVIKAGILSAGEYIEVANGAKRIRLDGNGIIALNDGAVNRITMDALTELLAINDGTRDRIQLGKVGADYTMKVVDATGNVMWDATTGAKAHGITGDSVIQKAIVDEIGDGSGSYSMSGWTDFGTPGLGTAYEVFGDPTWTSTGGPEPVFLATDFRNWREVAQISLTHNAPSGDLEVTFEFYIYSDWPDTGKNGGAGDLRYRITRNNVEIMEGSVEKQIVTRAGTILENKFVRSVTEHFTTPSDGASYTYRLETYNNAAPNTGVVWASTLMIYDAAFKIVEKRV